MIPQSDRRTLLPGPGANGHEVRMTISLNAIITQKQILNPDLAILRIAPVGWRLPPFKPGQFAVVGLPGAAPRILLSDPEDPPPAPHKFIRRAYFIASSSRDQEYIELYVALVRSGELTPRLFNLEVGAQIHLAEKITGMFTLDSVPESAHLVFIATGTGVAPYMSMLRTEVLAHPKRHVAVLHGARHSWDLGYRAELTTLSRHVPSFVYLPIVSRPQQELSEWRGETGHVQQLWARGALTQAWGFEPTPLDTHVFLCGNPAMVEDAMRVLGERGFREHTRSEPGQIHVEKYW